MQGTAYLKPFRRKSKSLQSLIAKRSLPVWNKHGKESFLRPFFGGPELCLALAGRWVTHQFTARKSSLLVLALLFVPIPNLPE